MVRLVLRVTTPSWIHADLNAIPNEYVREDSLKLSLHGKKLFRKQNG